MKTNVSRNYTSQEGHSTPCALDVAEYIISYEKSKDQPICNLRIQMLLYFVQGTLMLNNSDVYFCQNLQAWEFGPVVPDVYDTYKAFSWLNVKLRPGAKGFGAIEDQGLCEIITAVLEQFRNVPDMELVALAHSQSPWRDAYVPGKTMPITRHALQSTFCKV